MGYSAVGPHGVQFTGSLTPREVEALVRIPALRVVQASEPVEPATWDLLNDALLPRRPDVAVRVYAFYGLVCDLSFLRRLTNVRRLYVDRMMEANGIEHVRDLARLQSLHVDIYSLPDFGFLSDLPTTITDLGLGRTRSKKPSIEALSRFADLTTLYLEGQQKGIEALSCLHRLEDLTLRSISTDGVAYLAGLERLRSLDIKLGGTRDLSALAGNRSIEYLELWMVRGLSDLSVISTLTGLQYLFLQALKQVTTLPDPSRLTRLRRLVLEMMHGLTNVDALATAPALEEFLHVAAHGLQPEDYAAMLRLPTLRQASVGFGSDRKNRQFDALRDRAGVGDIGGICMAPFVFQR